MDIPTKCKELNTKLIVSADDYKGNKSVRKLIHATLSSGAKKTAIVIGINPSIASDVRSDRTFTKTGRYLDQYGVSDFYMLNLYETVSPNPKDIKPKDITNWRRHRVLFDEADFIVTAWGTENVHLEAKEKASRFLESFRDKVFCVRDDKGRGSRHPRRYAYKDELAYFFDTSE